MHFNQVLDIHCCVEMLPALVWQKRKRKGVCVWERILFLNIYMRTECFLLSGMLPKSPLFWKRLRIYNKELLAICYGDYSSENYTQQNFMLSWVLKSVLCTYIFFSFILLIHEGSHREVYREFQPSYDIFRRWCQGFFRPKFRAPPAYTAQLLTLRQHRVNI